MTTAPSSIRTVVACRRRPRAAVLLAALGVAIAAGSTHADYHVIAFRNTPGFSALMNQDAASASAAIPDYSSVVPTFALSNNRCVAELLAGELSAALSSCNKAMRNVSSSASSSGTATNAAAQRRGNLSSLLSNRGVVYALQGKSAEATDDFERAVSLDAENTVAERNLAYMKSLQVEIGQR